jgi:nucleotide-binding universal stress UspA family protein
MFGKMLVPLDGSKRAEAILPHVEELAHRYDKSQVLLLQVIELVPTTIFISDAVAPLNQEAINIVYKEARDYLERLQARLQENGIEAHVHVSLGPVVGTIIELAVQENVDLVALASHGRTGLPAFFYGSVAAGVLHRIDRPLLIVRSIQPRSSAGER